MRRPMLAPALIALAPLPQLIAAAHAASWSTLGRDQGIFQYIAWAASRGEKLYRDVRDVNGPLVAMTHLVLQALGGADEHRFRVLDLLFTSATFAFAGACLPSLLGRDVARRERAAWGAAALVLLLAQYLTYGFWDTAQRESFFDWFLAIATGALLVAQSSRSADRRARGWLALAGACSVAPVFGKPTYALFTVAHVVTVLVDDAAEGRRRRLVAFAAGGAAATGVMLAFLFAYGDLASYLRISLVDVPTMYRFIWPRSARALVTMPGYAMPFATAAVASCAGVALVVTGRLPRRALAVALVPVLAAVSILVQAKGFPYHFHPLSFGVDLVGLALLVVALERRPRLALAFAVLFAARGAIVAHAASARAAAERASAYVRVDYFPAGLRRAAAEIAATTTETDRVQAYGMDAYLLFLARRLSATPYIYAYDLDVDAALAGSYDADGPHPTAEQAARIVALRDAHERDLVDRLERAPPPAFVFVDRSPLMSSADAVRDFEDHCPTAASLVFARYHEAADFEGIRVWSRADLR